MAAPCAAFLLLSAVILAVADASFCNGTKGSTERYVSYQGRVMNITLHWASDPARAASALFAVQLRSTLNYQRVFLRRSPYLDLRTFADKVPHTHTRRYDEVILALSTAWDPESEHKSFVWKPNSGQVCDLAGPRLEEFGASDVPVQQRLHVYIAQGFRNRSQCANVTDWGFFMKLPTLQECGFTHGTSSIKSAVVYQLDLDKPTEAKLNEFADKLNFEIQNTTRTQLFQMVENGNHSFLFIDYGMWSDVKNVIAIPQPFCLPGVSSTCLLKPSKAIAMRIGDVSLLTDKAPTLMEFAYKYKITPKAIREILELESQGKDIEQAAEQWAVNNDKPYNPGPKRYDLAVFYCKDDPHYKKYDDFIVRLCNGDTVDKMFGTNFKIRPVRYLQEDCSDVNYIRNRLNNFLSISIKERLIGALVGSVKNITHVARKVDGLQVPVLFYDAMGLDTASSKSTWLTTGQSRHIAFALRQFLLNLKWKRVAVISEPTETADRFLIDLKAVSHIAIGDHSVPLNLSEADAENVLQKLLRYENARIIFVNTNYRDAATILAAAAKLRMNSTKEYAWIVREWRQDNKTVDIRHFTFSFWCRCGRDASASVGLPELREQMDRLYPNCTWPPHVAAIGDALFTILNGFKTALDRCPQMREDQRHEEAIKVFERSLIDNQTQGLIQNLTFKGHAPEETVIFLDEWHGDKHNHLARWRVNANTGKVLTEHEKRAVYPQGDQPHDGSSECFASSGDPYLPTCHDWEWAIVLIFLILMPPTILLSYRYLRRRLKEHEKMIICKVLAQRQQRAAALSTGYLVDRSALSIRHELGSGRFGYVRLAWLRLPGSKPRFVAVKALRDQQDESEILHEACILASLHHENIIRLVGVCIDKEPPLVLMEVAFFGDLLQYLRDRRYLAEGFDTGLTQQSKSDEEASHVSAEALTRLARQAASALAYLAWRGVVHRDLRASNCLVDANRCLKLADFGLARETKATSSDGGTEYACRRRGLFPVLWMAPESLIYGVFSAASDVWALGVLLFEVVTLGARPFGDMSPLRVMEFVASGGKPSMPKDATPHTVSLAQLCWQPEPDQRPTAANVVAYLSERPFALRPAFDDDSQPADADSGCGESPMDELIQC